MINWDENLIVEDKLQKKSRSIMKKLEKGKYVKNLFLIASPTNEANLYDIHEAKNLIFPYYKAKEIKIFAMASSMEEAENQLLQLLEARYAQEKDAINAGS